MEYDKLSPVRVGVREAPFRSFLGRQEPSIVHFSPEAGNSLVVDQNDYHFDHAFRSTVSQLELYGALIMPLVGKVFCGFECTVMAYGQTGTGKSYSMGMTADNQATSEEHLGVLPRCLCDILDRVAAKQENTLERIQVSASYIEIYNEKAYDLLAATPMDPMLASRSDSCTCLPLASQEDLQRLLQLGNNNRHVRRTNMNANSSRSHAIVTIHLRRQGGQLSRMNIVDLAGSEGVRRTGHEGVARQEGVSINMGLLSVNKVVLAMAAGHAVIPYRDSVLTTVLQKSLTSQSYLTLLACISPHACDLSETISTLRFAKSAKRLRLNPQQLMMSRNHQLQQQQQRQQQQTLPARTPHALRRPLASSTTVKVSRPTQHGAQNSYYLMPPKPKESMPLMQLQRTRSEMGLTPKAKKRAREELQLEMTMDAPSDSHHSAISLVEKGCSGAVSLSNSETETTLVEPLSGSNVTLKQEQEQDSNGPMGPPQPPPDIPLFHSSLLSIAEEPDSQQQKLQQRQLLFDNTCSPIVLPAAGPLEMSGIQPLEISDRPVLRARRFARLNSNSNRQQSSTEQQQQPLQQNQHGLRRSMRLAVKLESAAVTANHSGHLATQDSGSAGGSRKRSRAAIKRWINKQRITFLNQLNTADERELKKLPGIGGKTAFTLVLQRGRLGGFQSLRQVQELPIWTRVKWTNVCSLNGLDPYV